MQLVPKACSVSLFLFYKLSPRYASLQYLPLLELVLKRAIGKLLAISAKGVLYLINFVVRADRKLVACCD